MADVGIGKRSVGRSSLVGGCGEARDEGTSSQEGTAGKQREGGTGGASRQHTDRL